MAGYFQTALETKFTDIGWRKMIKVMREFAVSDDRTIGAGPRAC